MGKFSEKLVVYLDQNFISNMAKAGRGQEVNPSFKRIYELLHQGFLDEKLVVPYSFFHDIESSLIPDLAGKIGQYQAYLGQTQLKGASEVKFHQIVKGAYKFLGRDGSELSMSDAFMENPDDILKHLNVRVKMPILGNPQEERARIAVRLQALVASLADNKVSFKDQLQKEFSEIGQAYEGNFYLQLRDIFGRDAQKIKEFVSSACFKDIPIISINGRLWAKLITDFRSRPIQAGDVTDIDIISAYLPYVDVFATDHFMMNLIKNLSLDEGYKTTIFSAAKGEPDKFEQFLTDYLKTTKPVNVPAVSIFVLSDANIKADSAAFFKRLCHLHNRQRKWVEVFGFDDGNMPEYSSPWPMPKTPDLKLQFYGLQDVNVIKLPENFNGDDVLELCLKECRSEYFVLIDSYRDLPDNFIETLITYCEAGKERILNYSIIKTN